LCARGGIWTDWPLDRYRRETGEAISREAFSQRIVADEAFAAHWGDLGPVYGKQWVDWPVYEPAGEEGLFRRRPQGINQVAQLIAGLRSNPGGRRHIVEGWNVAELDAMALPPQDLSIPCRGQSPLLRALSAQLRRGAGVAVQLVGCCAVCAHGGAAMRP
jgi:thymidylate synthase